MLVSIIIPAKNEERNLERLLKQLRQQSFQDYEVVVADAQSTDHTREVAKRLGAKVVAGGLPGAGRNLGAAASHGELLIFMDADGVLPHKHFLRDIIKEFHLRRLDIAAIPVEPFQGTWADRLLFRFYNIYARLTTRILPHAVGACMIVKRFLHDQIGGFDETITLAEDMHYARQAAQVGEFDILHSHTIQTAMRRLRKEGRVRLAIKYILGELHMVLKGPIRGHIPYMFDYEEDTAKTKR
ncbi:MAG: glycosyltransferase [Patescibacteria group bacterium]